MAQDIDGQVAKYRGLVEEVAEQVVRSKPARKVMAEYDDLVQEGLIAVWQSLGRGVTPGAGIVRLRMRGWIRLMARQTGQTLPKPLRPQHIPYEQLLPMDDFRAPGEA